MIDRDKVLKGLKHCIECDEGDALCNGCPYEDDCFGDSPDRSILLRDALELLKNMPDPSVRRFTPAEVFFEMVHSSWEDDRFGPDKPARYTPAEVLGMLMALVITEGERNGEYQ